jgi:hypothetical protein
MILSKFELFLTLRLELEEDLARDGQSQLVVEKRLANLILKHNSLYHLWSFERSLPRIHDGTRLESCFQILGGFILGETLLWSWPNAPK